MIPRCIFLLNFSTKTQPNFRYNRTGPLYRNTCRERATPSLGRNSLVLMKKRVYTYKKRQHVRTPVMVLYGTHFPPRVFAVAGLL